MKKFILCALLSIAATFAFGQTKCNSGDINLNLSFKRCIVNNNSAIIDFIITNLKKDDLYMCMSGCRAYDDEGNCYTRNVEFDFGNTGDNSCILPTETPVKLRCIIGDIDEFATKIVRLDLIYTKSDSMGYTMTVKEIAFSRN